MDSVPRVLVVERDVVSRKTTTRILEHKGFACESVGDGAEALQNVRDGQYDVVVTALQLPTLHGHGLCVELLRLAERPIIIVLTGLREPKLVRDLIARGIDDVFFKPADYPELVAAIRRLLLARDRDCLGPDKDPECEETFVGQLPDYEAGALSESAVAAPEGERELPIPERALYLVKSPDNIPPMPQLLIKLLAHLRAEEISIPQLARDIASDVRATGDLLKVVNSASTGLRRRITSVLDAVTLLGPKRAISVVVSAATVSAQSQLLTDWLTEDRIWYQQRSVLTAHVAAVFARRMETVSSETAFVMGIFQDAGLLVLVDRFPKRYGPLLQQFRKSGRMQLPIVESELFKTNHAEVSAAILHKWELPSTLIEPILLHHQGQTRHDLSDACRSFVRVMSIGEAFADLRDVPHPARRHALNRLLSAAYGGRLADRCRKCLAEAVETTAEAFRMFSLPVPENEAFRQLLQQMATTGGDGADGRPNLARPNGSESPPPSASSVP